MRMKPFQEQPCLNGANGLKKAEKQCNLKYNLGCPTALKMDGYVEKVKNILRYDHCLALIMISEELNIETVQLTKTDLGMTKVYTMRNPKNFTNECICTDLITTGNCPD